MLHFLFLRRVQITGTQIAGFIAQILRVVIVKFIGRYDLDHRQCLVTQDCDGIFATADKAFCKYQLVMLCCFSISGGQLANRLYFADAEARTFIGGFDKQWQTQLLHDRLPIAVFIEQHIIRHRKFCRLPHHFGAPLVHGQRGSHHPTAGIGYIQQFQSSLHRAVFTVTAMQRDESAIKTVIGQRLQILHGGIKRIGIHTTAL